MAEQGLPGPFERNSTDVEPCTGQSPLPHPTRHDTVSTVSSEKYSPLPPGAWTIPIHGNCPRCHHHHKAFVIRVKVCASTWEVNDVHCENCDQKWLAVGGGSSTQISLLSSRTTDLDSVEIDFRNTLIRMVRSATAITSSMALSSVPESSSRVPSRQSSVRTPSHGSAPGSAAAHASTKDADLSQAASNTQATTSPSAPPDPTTHKPTISSDGRRARKALADLKCRLKNALPFLKNVHLRQLLKFPERSKLTDKASGKRPVLQTQEGLVSAFPGPKTEPSRTRESRVDSKDIGQAQNARACVPKKRTAEAMDKSKSFDKDTLGRMSPNERKAWIRDQITFKCRCARDCTCRSDLTQAHPMVTSSTRAHSTELSPFVQPPLHRRHSVDLVGLGSHLDDFPPGAFFPNAGPLSISVATRTSQADTAVNVSTATSGPRNSLLDVRNHRRHRSRSPRPVSLLNSRHSWHLLRQNGFEGRASMDSILAGGPGRSVSSTGRRGTDRLSIASQAATAEPPSIDGPASPTPTQRSTPEEEDTPSNGQGPFIASTPRLSGYRTPDERNGESDPTPPADSSRS